MVQRVEGTLFVRLFVVCLAPAAVHPASQQSTAMLCPSQHDTALGHVRLDKAAIP